MPDDLVPFGSLLDATLAFAALAAFVAGTARGFSGFGTAMVLMPIASALYAPTLAIVAVMICDSVMTLPLFIRALPRCRWRPIIPMVVCASVTAPLGGYLLTRLDPVLVRWIMSGLIIGVVVVLAAGWRYRRPVGLLTSGAIGGASGLSGGMTALSGPPVILFWLGGQTSSPAQVRTDIIVYFGLLSVASAFSFWVNAIVTWYAVQVTLLLLPAYGLGLWVGARGFRHSNEQLYRMLAYGLCLASATAALPLWG